MDGFEFAPATEDELATIDRALDAFNADRTGIDDSRPVGISIRDRAGRLVGGLKGTTGLGWLHVAVLWLDKACRGRGLGAELLRRAESLAGERGCRGVCLTSFSFQAPGFYLRHGYEVFGQLDDYPPGQSLFFLRKAIR
jgi:GNAT superfamily N-acetyltransferase